MRRAAVTLIVIAAVVAPVAGAAVGRAQITVYAAASLSDAFPKIDRAEKYSFGGSNMLASQIQQGAPADVFASANTSLPRQLYAKRLCSKPVVFTRNGLVVVVPKANPAGIDSVYDLAKRGLKVVVAGTTVPIGNYTAQVLAKMKLADAVERNVVSEETDVRGVLSKVVLGEADAGFVYSTDAKTAGRQVRTIKVPAWAQPNVQYSACVVRASSHQSDAQAFVKRLIGAAAQKKLIAAGFLPRVKKR